MNVHTFYWHNSGSWVIKCKWILCKKQKITIELNYFKIMCSVKMGTSASSFECWSVNVLPVHKWNRGHIVQLRCWSRISWVWVLEPLHTWAPLSTLLNMPGNRCLICKMGIKIVPLSSVCETMWITTYEAFRTGSGVISAIIIILCCWISIYLICSSYELG